MVRVAAERIELLFSLAEKEASVGSLALADRYVALARRIGMRYNVRLLPGQSDLYCRGCSRFWIEGKTVRTRLRSGIRVRTCLGCGRSRRVRYSTGGRPPRRPRGHRASSLAGPEGSLSDASTAPDDEPGNRGGPEGR